MEERLARLEEKSEHLQSDFTAMKADIRRIEDKIDHKIDPKIDSLRDKIDSVKDSVAALEGRMRDSFEALRVGRAMDKVWALLSMAALLGVMARGFKWI